MSNVGEPAPSEDVIITSGDWRAVITTSGARLRQLARGNRDVIDGFGRLERPQGARGQILAPWTNRLRDGRFEFDGEVHQVPVTDPATSSALHGLVGGIRWTVRDVAPAVATFEVELGTSRGYPWRLNLGVTYELGPDGLTVTHRVSNESSRPAPYAIGAHPYVTAGSGAVDDWTVDLPASQVMLIDAKRMLPTGIVDVADVDLDFRVSRRVGSERLNHAFSGFERKANDRASVSVVAQTGEGVTVWAGVGCRWIQVYTGDHDPVAPRRSIAVEPMSAPADAFNSGQDLVVLSRAGQPGSGHVMQWGITTVPPS